MTATGAIVGSPIYMSPEQARGQEIVPASDVFSLGVMLYHITTGRPPFAGRDPLTAIAAILRGEFLRPSQVDAHVGPALEAVILRCLKSAPQRPLPRRKRRRGGAGRHRARRADAGRRQRARRGAAPVHRRGRRRRRPNLRPPPRPAFRASSVRASRSRRSNRPAAACAAESWRARWPRSTACSPTPPSTAAQRRCWPGSRGGGRSGSWSAPAWWRPRCWRPAIGGQRWQAARRRATGRRAAPGVVAVAAGAPPTAGTPATPGMVGAGTARSRARRPAARAPTTDPAREAVGPATPRATPPGHAKHRTGGRAHAPSAVAPGVDGGDHGRAGAGHDGGGRSARPRFRRPRRLRPRRRRPRPGRSPRPA